MKKKEGSVDKIALALLTMLISGVLIMTSIETTHALEKKSEINSLIRQHMLYMESNGDLTDIQISELRQDIESLGVEVVGPGTGNGIEVSKGVSYGKEIFIEVTGFMPLRSFNTDIDEANRVEKLPFKVRRSSIAKND